MFNQSLPTTTISCCALQSQRTHSAFLLGRRYVAHKEGAVGLQGPCDYSETQVDLAGKLIGAEAESDWLKVTPWGFRLMLNWVNDRCVPAALWASAALQKDSCVCVSCTAPLFCSRQHVTLQPSFLSCALDHARRYCGKSWLEMVGR